MRLQNGFIKIGQMIGGSVTEFDKITPQTYIDMNKEFVEDGTMVRIEVPTQEAIDKWKKWVDPDMHNRTTKPRDMVQDMWDAIGGRPCKH